MQEEDNKLLWRRKKKNTKKQYCQVCLNRFNDSDSVLMKPLAKDQVQGWSMLTSTQ